MRARIRIATVCSGIIGSGKKCGGFQRKCWWLPSEFSTTPMRWRGPIWFQLLQFVHASGTQISKENPIHRCRTVSTGADLEHSENPNEPNTYGTSPFTIRSCKTLKPWCWYFSRSREGGNGWCTQTWFPSTMEKPGWSEPPAETLEQTRVIREVHVLKSSLGLLSHRIVNHQWPPVNHWIWGSFGAWVHRQFLTWVCCRTVRTLKIYGFGHFLASNPKSCLQTYESKPSQKMNQPPGTVQKVRQNHFALSSTFPMCLKTVASSKMAMFFPWSWWFLSSLNGIM